LDILRQEKDLIQSFQNASFVPFSAGQAVYVSIPANCSEQNKSGSSIFRTTKE